ncbi:hypothetical protein DV495_003310 [Geotrichum candidum]|uniref:Similar to Saccharomyces cerevisiae YGL186C TPN1 Plasma membrane pyridoxine (Vitamin B6) transporter n=1 Tax=Geotrichum candidum TaxID=1173061 RepID=A0A0J9XBF0_GEOCN|nr:hypothetical protein DV452_001141 [Geotrichum candidum]KAI9214124.1 hypothetical protein DS838_000963 [Geotrichum bryndzae]KAF5126708.1 hypothetical protein DV495_003310 [Geotrichum candidum]KAF7501860.1 hypothetical protein DV113_000193 [Geotrichum candidum]KAI8131670.1 hypothetical protein DUD61_004670 [Geotrichum candidum]
MPNTDFITQERDDKKVLQESWELNESGRGDSSKQATKIVTTPETPPLVDPEVLTFRERLLYNFRRFNTKLDSFGVELRGIHRVPAEERFHSPQIVFKLILLWFSACGGLSSMSGFFLGPLVFGLGFKDSMSAGISGAGLGCLVAAYAATMGPRSGLRQMVLSRFMFGWWPAKLIALLNVITLLGWSVVNSITGGQILAALSDNKVPIEVGIVIITVVSLFVAIFGIKYVQYFEDYAALPVNLSFLLLYICSSRYFNTSLPSVGEAENIRASWVSFFTLTFGVTSAWAGVTSDYYIDFPETTSRIETMAITFFCILIPTLFVGILGICIATGAVGIPSLNDAYNELGNGGLLNAAFSRWGGGGKFVLVLMYMSLVSNNIINTYSIALSTQVWGLFAMRVPRYALVILTAAIYFVLAMAGRNTLANILNNFLPLIGYWSMLYFVIIFQETIIFRRRKIPGTNDVYNWADWDNKLRLPTGIAALAAFLCGIVGVILGMCQVWYVGPIAKQFGEEGSDVGTWFGALFTLVTYPPFRYLELKYAPWSDKHLM